MCVPCFVGQTLSATRVGGSYFVFSATPGHGGCRDFHLEVNALRTVVEQLAFGT